MKKAYRRILALALVCINLIFWWHMELVTDFDRTVWLTNGFTDPDPVKVYHLLLYLSLGVILLSAFVLMRED